MFKDIVSLIKTKQVSDGAGGYETDIESEKAEVFANKKSVRQTEFYLAAQADMQVESVFRISIFDYEDERILKHNEKYYTIIRTYETGDFIELTCQRRLGGLNEVL